MADRKISQLNSLTSPAAADTFVVVDADEPDSSVKNKQLRFDTLHKAVPDGSESAPAISFLEDASVTGFYRSASNEIAISANSSYVAKFTTAGFQLGTGTAAAQFHLFSTDTTDQVIIENTDAGLDTAPDVVLYRNSASPAANDNLGNLEFRGENDAGEAIAYGQILTRIADVTDGSEDGILQLMTAAAGTTAARVTLKSDKVGVNESDPQHPLHITESVANTGLFIESAEAVAVSAADITLYHHRGSSVAGQDSDVLSSINFPLTQLGNSAAELTKANNSKRFSCKLDDGVIEPAKYVTLLPPVRVSVGDITMLLCGEVEHQADRMLGDRVSRVASCIANNDLSFPRCL